MKGSLPTVRATEEGGRLFRMVMALPLLPAALMLRAYEEVLLPLSRRLGLNQRQRNDIRVFMRNYVLGFWLRRVSNASSPLRCLISPRRNGFQDFLVLKKMGVIFVADGKIADSVRFD